MKATVWTIAVLSLCFALLAGMSTRLAREASQSYYEQADQMETLVLAGDWPELDRALEAFENQWQVSRDQLQMWINHQDTDDVNLALGRLRSGILIEEKALAMEALSDLKESCLHLYHRDALRLTNLI